MAYDLEHDGGAAGVRRADFGPDFRWGCSTSAYQIEGGARADGRVDSIWDTFCRNPGVIRDSSNAEVACDHYARWAEDLDLARRLGVNAYRFSIAWPRVIGDGVMPNQRGLDFYERLVDGMLERGLEPWATLYHWDLPQILQDRGGWAERTTMDAFETFADQVTRRLGDRVRHWITHNEPWCTAFHGNWEGNHAPGNRDLGTAVQVAHHVLVSHGRAIDVIRANVLSASAGITLSLHPVRAASAGADDQEAARRHDGLRNRWFLDPLFGRGYPLEVLAALGRAAPEVRSGDLELIARASDFLGVNYYFPEVVAAAPSAEGLGTRVVAPSGVERTGFGWEVAPDGMVDLLRRVHEEYRPPVIHLTENGSTFEDILQPDGRVHDAARTRYLQRHLAALHRAQREGIPVKSYFAWSLLDNFEWAEGYSRRFGLAYVDYATQARHLKDSGLWYGAFLDGTETAQA